MEKIKEIIRNANDNMSIENFISMYNALKEINDKGKHKKYKEDLNELIQLIIDYLIYGDKKNTQLFFDNFCELDFMQEFIKASKSKTTDILLQIIKSMSALILTITNQAFLFYVFSNNFINNIITNDKIIESSEDFLSFYINFLKSLSLKIDLTTIKLFFHPEINSFPLLENALKLYNYEDSMIRNVVKNIFLKFATLSKDYQPLKEFMLSLPAIKFFCFISCRLTDITLDLNESAGYNVLYKFNNTKEFIFKYEKLKALQDDILDDILYINDLFGINDSQITYVLLNTLFYYYIGPLLLGSIYHYQFFFFDNDKKKNPVKYLVAPEIALYILTLFISNVKNDSLLNILSYFLFKKKINIDIIDRFINIHFSDKEPKRPSNYSYTYKENNEKEKNLTFCQYIAYNFNKKFLCDLIMKTKDNSRFKEVIELHEKYEKFFDDSFIPEEYYNYIFNDTFANFNLTECQFIKDQHILMSKATGIQSGITEDQYLDNFLRYLNEKRNMQDNPIRKILFEEIFKNNFEIVNFGVNLLLYSTYYNIMNDENNNMNKSLSRKMLYFECEMLPYDLYANKGIINKTIIINQNENNINNDENNINNDNNDDENIIIEEKENNINNENNIISTNNNKIEKNEIKIENKDNKEIKEENINKYERLMIFKTEKYEAKYNNTEDIYNKDFIYDNDILNNLINLLQNSKPYCSLQMLLIIYNIKYISQIININKNTTDKISLFKDEQKIKLLSIFVKFIKTINTILKNQSTVKYNSFESLETILNLYNESYSFNKKNLITKYVLTPYFICIPSTAVDVEDFPFKMNNNKFVFEIFLLGYFCLYELIFGKKKEDKFPLKSTNLEYKSGDKINLKKINVHDKKMEMIKVLLKKKNRDDFDDINLFVNHNSIIFGYEEKNEETGEEVIRIRNIHPLRELEIFIENYYPNSLEFNVKSIEYIIKCESDEKRKELKNNLENKRNEILKLEIESLIKVFAEEEKTYSQILDNTKFDFYMGTKIDENF